MEQSTFSAWQKENMSSWIVGKIIKAASETSEKHHAWLLSNKLNTVWNHFETILQLPSLSFHYLFPHYVWFLSSIFEELLSLTHTHTHTHTHSTEKHICSLCPSAGCWGFTGIRSQPFICAIFRGRAVSEVLWEVIQKRPSQGTRRREKQRRGFVKYAADYSSSSLSLSLSQTLSSFQVKSRHTLGQKRMFTLLNNAGSPQFLHLSSLFVFFFQAIWNARSAPAHQPWVTNVTFYDKIHLFYSRMK